MGDQADNIQGLPKLCHPDFTDDKLKAVGPVLTHSIINPTKSVKECFALTKDLFERTGRSIGGYKNYRDASDVEWHKVMISEMKLLWMRRENNENDVLKWLKETT